MEIKQIYLPIGNYQVEFEDLNSYLKMAKGFLWCTASQRYGRLFANKLLKDEDVIANAAFELMRADLTYEKSKTSLKTWRIQHIRWYICKYCAIRDDQIKKKPAYHLLSHADFSREYANNISNNDNVVNSAIQTEKQLRMQEALRTVKLTKQQRTYFEDYYLNGVCRTYKCVTYKNIGIKYGVSPERVRQVVKQAKFKLKRHIEAKYSNLIPKCYYEEEHA